MSLLKCIIQYTYRNINVLDNTLIVRKFCQVNKPLINEPKQARSRERYDRLIEVAANRFLAGGFDATSLDDVINETGGSRSAVYKWFGDKEGLLTAVVETECGRVLDTLYKLDTTGEPHDWLSDIGSLLAHLLLSDRVVSLYRLIISESAIRPGVATAFYQAGPKTAHEIIATRLEAWMAEGAIRRVDALSVARAFVEMAVGDLRLRALVTGVPPSKSQIRTAVSASVDLVINGLMPCPKGN